MPNPAEKQPPNPNPKSTHSTIPASKIATKEKKQSHLQYQELSPVETFKQTQPQNAYFFEKGFFNYWLYNFINKAINIGQTKSFDFDMLYRPPDDLNYEQVYPKFVEFYKKSKKTYPKRKFYFTLLKFLGSDFIWGGSLKIISYVIQIPLPFLIQKYLDWL